MDLDALIAQLPDLKAEAARERQRAKEVTARADALDRVIRGIEALIPSSDARQQSLSLTREDSECIAGDGTMESQEPSENAHLQGIEAVRKVISQVPDRLWRPRDVHEVLEQRGWISTTNQAPIRSTGVAMHRMAKRGELVKVGRGLFRMPETEEVETED